MSSAVSAADANRDFSKLLRTVRDGATVVITSHGKPVAKLIPIVTEDRVRRAAKELLLERLRAEPAVESGRRWTRDEIYDRGRDRRPKTSTTD